MIVNSTLVLMDKNHRLKLDDDVNFFSLAAVFAEGCSHDCVHVFIMCGLFGDQSPMPTFLLLQIEGPVSLKHIFSH